MKPLVIRADASQRIGTGHVARCLALAQAWECAAGTVIFASALESPGMTRRLDSDGFDIVRLNVQPGSAIDATEVSYLALDRKADWVVTDGYHFNVEYHRIIKDAGLRLMAIDDEGKLEQYLYPDIILNQNIYATEDLYHGRINDARLLLGTGYVLLRNEYLQWLGWNRETPKSACKLLVTLGGSDPYNVTLKVIEALKNSEFSDLEVKIVVGFENRQSEEISEAVQQISGKVELLTSVTDMAKLMAWADMAVSGAGSTCWELAFMGLPALLIVIAENQSKIASGLDEIGAATNLGWHSAVSSSDIAIAIALLSGDADRRSSMNKISRALVDGNSMDRVIHALIAES